jgi:phage terminase large subunit GpA-like protein
MSAVLTILAALWRPRERLTVSEWADRHRVLSAKASSEPGPWRTSRMPHLAEIMDSLSEHAECEEVWCMKPAQSGGTEAATNWIGYIMDHVRTAKPTLIVVPTDRLLVRWVHQRLRPMIEGAEVLRTKLDVSKSRDGTNRLDIIDYPGGLLYLTTAGSASNLKSDSICYVIGDEIDEYDVDVGGRGDPFRLIASRQANFPRRKRFYFSTPSVAGASRVAAGYESSDQRRRLVPCPHCGAEQELRWEQVQWDRDATHVWYVCAENGCVIEERQKDAMLAAGRWVATYPERSNKIRGFAWNALYNPTGLGYSWRDLVHQWLDAQGDDAKLQPFVNERLGLPWQDQRTATRPEDLQHRALAYPLRTIPPGSRIALITAGVDTQDDRLEVQIIGWRADGGFYVLDYAALPGDPGRAEVWASLTDLLLRPLLTPAGLSVGVDLTAIDQGGHYTEAVKSYVRAQKAGGLRCISIVGSKYRLGRALGRPTKTDYTVSGRTVRGGMELYQVGTEIGKDRLYHILRTDADHEPDARLGHFSADLPAPDYWHGLLSEVWNPKRQRYEPRRGQTRRNEPLDTWVYAYAAGHHPALPVRLDRGRAREWAARADRWHGSTAPAPPLPAAAPAPPASSAPRALPRPRPAPSPATGPAGGGFGREGWRL